MNTSILERLLQPVTDALTPEVAARIADAEIDPATQARISELAEKADLGTLTEDEQAEYSQFVDGIALLGIIQAKARILLRRNGS